MLVLSLPNLIKNVPVSTRYLGALLGILVWDSLSTLRAEVKYIWMDKRWTQLKVAYIANKYWTLLACIVGAAVALSRVPNATCDKIFWILGMNNIVTMLLCDVVVSIRVLAIYAGNRRILCLLIGLFTLEAATMIGAGSRLRPISLPPALGDLIGYNGCTCGDPVSWPKLNAMLYWMPSLIYNAFCLALIIGRHVWISRKSHSMKLMKRLARDGVAYFAVIVAVDIPNIYLCPQDDPSLSNINVYPSTVLKSLMCTRLILSFRAGADTSDDVKHLKDVER